MIKRSFLITIIVLIGLNQSSNGQIIQKTIEKIKNSKFIYYTSVLKYKAPFGDSFSTDTIKAFIGIKPALNEAGGYFKLETSKQRAIYDGNSLIQLNLRDSSYSFEKEILYNQLYRNSLLYYSKYLEKVIKTPSKVKRLGDTLINNKLFYHLRVNKLDSMVNGKNIFVFTDLVIDKRNYLPFSIRTENQGFVGTTLVKAVEANTFYNYKTNQKLKPDFFLAKAPDNFKLETTKKAEPSLAKGTKAPAIELYDTFGNLFKLETLKGKIVLLNFTSNGCQHSVEAIQSLNKIHKKYQDLDFSIISINPIDDKDAVLKFNKKFNVEYSTYINGKLIADAYHVNSYPLFYLVDKEGNIAECFHGYYQELERQLIEKIESLK